MPSTKLHGSELIEEKFGYWPNFHDAEILTISLDRVDPSLSIRILIGHWHLGETPAESRIDKHYEADLLFHDIDSLELWDFNHQNVIGSLTLSLVTERRWSRDEERIKVEIETAFGLRGSFTCSDGEVIGIRETNLETGNPISYRRQRL
jgi:hypothetical protein